MKMDIFSRKVYLRNEEEYDKVKLRAAQLGKSVSTYIRDLLLEDLTLAKVEKAKKDK